MTITIRRLRAADRQAWEALWRGYQDFYEADLSQDTERLWRALLQPEPDGPHALVAEDADGAVVGLAHFLFHDTTWSPQPRCYLNDLFTAEAARGKGVGAALIEAVHAAAEQAGASQTYWLTQDFNQTARKLYDRVGQLTPFIKYVR